MKQFMEEFEVVICGILMLLSFFLGGMGLMLATGFAEIFIITVVSSTEFNVSVKSNIKAVQILWNIKRGRIQVYHDTLINIIPKSFNIYSGYTVAEYIINKTSKERLQELAEYIKSNCLNVEAYCDIYLSVGNKLVAENRKILLDYKKITEYLMIYSGASVKTWNKKDCCCGCSESYLFVDSTGTIKSNGDFISVANPKRKQDPLVLFFPPMSSPRELATDRYFQNTFTMYRRNSSMEEIIRTAENSFLRYYVFDLLGPGNIEKTDTKAEDTLIVGANPEISEKINQIDKKIAQGMHLADINNLQWENVIRPNLQEVASKKKLNDKNKKEIIEILDMVSNNFVSEENEENVEVEATLTAVRSFLSINGCVERKEK